MWHKEQRQKFDMGLKKKRSHLKNKKETGYTGKSRKARRMGGKSGWVSNIKKMDRNLLGLKG